MGLHSAPFLGSRLTPRDNLACYEMGIQSNFHSQQTRDGDPQRDR